MIDIVAELQKGISSADGNVYAKRITPGRFVEESDCDIVVKKGHREAYLLAAKLFLGRKPHYLPWAELFDIRRVVTVGNEDISFFDSAYEDLLLDFFSSFLDPAGRIFIEYYADNETLIGLRTGFPAPVTRMGFKLFERGFTWFKDWYFPEGLLEGGQKLQAEKTSDPKSRDLQILQIKDATATFVEQSSPTSSQEPHLIRALERANRILEQEVFKNQETS